jgi:hypothetical protein
LPRRFKGLSLAEQVYVVTSACALVHYHQPSLYYDHVSPLVAFAKDRDALDTLAQSARASDMAAPPPPPPFASTAAAGPALLPGWMAYTTPQGQPYWANPSTGQSTYTPPFAAQAPPPPPPGFSTAIYAAPIPVAGPSTTIQSEPAKKKAKAKAKLPIDGTPWVRVTVRMFALHLQVEIPRCWRTGQ